MKLWLMSQADGPLGSVMADTEFLKAASLSGSTPTAVREVFRSANANTIDMQLARAGATNVERERQEIPDFLFWVSTPIFSDRATSLAIELGCEHQEFWPCRFQTNPDDAYFFHLPVRSFDIVDFEKSSFLMTLPGLPPLPMFLQTMTAKQISGFIPPCFRASIPGRDQVLAELFVRDEFKCAWNQNGFSGATFRSISD